MQAVSQQAAEIEAQRYTIRELGTPILPLYEGVIALPLVGAIDSYRATQVLERLLEAISEKQADIVILDITGVPVVDTGVANYLLQTARAAQLIGAQVVLVGIGVEIAQTLVQLGVSLNQIKVYANLQAGVSYALAQLGYKIAAIV
jgi:rsbT co-antagonist protein RsbR